MSWAEPVETPAGLREPRMVRGLRWPRMVADLPQTTGWTSRRRRRRFPAKRRARTSRGRRRSIAAGAKPGNKNFQKREENKTGWKWHRGHCIFWSSILSRMCRGCQERGYTELRETLYYNNTEITEIAGEQVHTKITLILDKDTGNTEDL